MRDDTPRLRLNRETVRELTRKELAEAAGGRSPQTDTCPPLTVTLLCNISGNCP